MNEDFKDLLCIIGAIIGAILLVITLSIGTVNSYQYLVDKPACEAYGVISKQKTFYSLGTSCIVERNGEWVNYEVAVGKKQEITLKQK